MARSMFPLRFRNRALGELVREVAEREGISEGELLERAVEREVVARGELLADELEASAAHLRTATSLVGAAEASKEAFAAGEASPDPLGPRRIERTRASGRAPLGAVAAFEDS